MVVIRRTAAIDLFHFASTPVDDSPSPLLPLSLTTSTSTLTQPTHPYARSTGRSQYLPPPCSPPTRPRPRSPFMPVRSRVRLANGNEDVDGCERQTRQTEFRDCTHTPTPSLISHLSSWTGSAARPAVLGSTSSSDARLGRRQTVNSPIVKRPARGPFSCGRSYIPLSPPCPATPSRSQTYVQLRISPPLFTLLRRCYSIPPSHIPLI